MTERPSLSRRAVLRRALLAAAGAAFAPWGARRALAQSPRPPRFSGPPFTLGVASGSPRADGVVIWTRLAPEPLAEGGGMAAENVTVAWEVARDEGFGDVVRSGTAVAYPERAHSVHVEVGGLDADRGYFYRFRAGAEASPVGRTRTAAAAGGGPARLRFAVASCQHYEQGYFAAYRHMAADDPDLVLFVGDYIYESSWGQTLVRRHAGGETRTLDDYRRRHAQYHTDPDLQRMHALVPWLVTWDDHEVDNDYADDVQEHLDPGFLQRRAAAYQAYFEHMPLRFSQLPRGPHLRLFDRFDLGGLARIHVLDDRQYRSPQACPPPGRAGSALVSDCPELERSERTLLGAEQERWLLDGLAASPARWNVIAQQTLMAPIDRKPGPGVERWTDGWDGYPASRRRILDALAARRASNPLVVGGDMHNSWVADLRAGPGERAPVVATEVCATSITSDGDAQAELEALLPENPHVRFVNGDRRGYALIELTAKEATARVRALDDVRRRDTGVSTLAAFVIADGRPGAQRA
jgi:alkaline phosphatase D